MFTEESCFIYIQEYKFKSIKMWKNINRFYPFSKNEIITWIINKYGITKQNEIVFSPTTHTYVYEFITTYNNSLERTIH